MNRTTILAVLLPFTLAAQTDSGLKVIEQWLQAEMTKLLNSEAENKKPVQTQSISIDRGSTTFVDQSSGSDFLSGAFNLAPVGGAAAAAGAGGNANSGSVTASVYSLWALASGSNPLLPEVYRARQNLRSVYLTLGREEVEAGNTNTPGTVAGVKWLIYNRRDASSIAQDKEATKLAGEIATGFASAAAQAAARIAQVLHQAHVAGGGTATKTQFLLTLTGTEKIESLLKEAGKEDEGASIVKDYAARSSAAEVKLKDFVAALRRRAQVSLAWQTTQRKGDLNDDHRLLFIFDRGVRQSLFFTFNASYDYSNSRKVGADVRGGRGAFDFRWFAVQPRFLSGKDPLQLGLAGEALRAKDDWQYRAQLQLVIPVAAGVNFPVSFGYGHPNELLRKQEKTVFGKFGLTFDVRKAALALQGALR
ncbi:MAG TPA: hypothetical protein DEH78_25405 [Solibacterales bacterium]|nr:hypothetical protein [Bryobacterales bacterium]